MSLGRTFSNDSTIEKDVLSYEKRRETPQLLKSVVQCDIFRPLRDVFFSEVVEDMISLRRANPVCCSVINTLSDDEDDEEEHKSMGLEVPYYPLVRQDALITDPPRYYGGSTKKMEGQSRDDRPGKASRSS
jgi:hypothetical protein